MKALSCCVIGTAALAILYAAPVLAEPPPQTMTAEGPPSVSERVDALRKQIVQLRAYGACGDAAPLAAEVLALQKATYGDNDWRTADAAAEVELLVKCTAMSPEDRQALAAADAADERIEVLYKEAKYDEALALIEQQIATYRRLLGNDSTEVALCLDNAAISTGGKGDRVAAEKLFKESLETYRHACGNRHPKVASVLATLGNTLVLRGAYGEAEDALQEALAMQRELLDPADPALAFTLTYLGALRGQAQSDCDRAEALYDEALRIFRVQSAGEETDIAWVLSEKVRCYHLRGMHRHAEAAAREALEIYRKVLGEDHPHTATLLLQWGRAQQGLGELAAAEDAFRRTLEIYQKAYSPDHVFLTAAQEALATLFELKGDYAAAEPLFRQSVETRRKVYGDQHILVGQALSNLAGTLLRKGEYAAAEAGFQEALAIHRYANDKSINLPTILQNLGVLARFRGDYASAERLFEEANELHRELGTSGYIDATNSLNNLATVKTVRGDYVTAQALLEQALSTRRDRLGEHPLVANTLNQLAELERKRGHVPQAVSLAEQALAIRRKIHGDAHPDVAGSLSMLGKLSAESGDLAAAEKLHREALAMNRELLGHRHPLLVEDLFLLAVILLKRGESEAAVSLLQESLALAEDQRPGVAGDERQRAAYADALKLPVVASLLADTLLRQGRPAQALETCERGRARALLDLLSRSERSLIDEVRATSASDANELEAALTAEESARRALIVGEARLSALSRDTSTTMADKPAKLLELKNGVRRLTWDLRDAQAQVMAKLRSVFPNAQPTTAGQLQSSLMPDEILLEFNWSQESVTLLIVPAVGQGLIQGERIVDDRESVSRLTSMVGSVMGRIKDRGVLDTQDQLSLELTERLFPRQIREQLRAASRVVFILDGPLRDLPMEALLVRDGHAKPRPFVDVFPPFVYADSATTFVNCRRVAQTTSQELNPESRIAAVLLGNPRFTKKPQAKPSPEGVVVMTAIPEGNAAKAGLCRGDVILEYDGQQTLTSRELKDAVQRADKPSIPVKYWRDGTAIECTVGSGKLGIQLATTTAQQALEVLAFTTRSGESQQAKISLLDQIRLYGGMLAPLPGTELECRSLAATIRRAGGAATLLLGEEATLPRLERAVRGRGIVHLATHGLMGTTERPYDASLALTAPPVPSADDLGFLTLEHMIRRWHGALRDCELVVLSGCDTQRGWTRGDSTLALPWGFLYAGAPTVVASLWKVDDAATTLLMDRFYTNLLETSASGSGGRLAQKDRALSDAKRWLRTLNPTTTRKMLVQMGFPESICTGPVEDTNRAPIRHESIGPPLQRDDSCDFSHPYYWAAFVLTGAPD